MTEPCIRMAHTQGAGSKAIIVRPSAIGMLLAYPTGTETALTRHRRNLLYFGALGVQPRAANASCHAWDNASTADTSRHSSVRREFSLSIKRTSI